MFRLLQQVLRFSATIIVTSYPFNKIRLLVDYYRLIIQSVYYHKFSSQNIALHRTTVLNYVVEFDDYGSFINMFEEIFLLKIYRRRILKGSSLIVDCGSNIGMSVLYFRLLYPSALIEAFEPDPDTFAILKRNVQYNKIESIILHNTALGNKKGTVSFFKSKKSTNSGLVPTENTIETITVPMEPLSHLLTQKVSILKIDTEGSEVEVINELIESGKIELIDQIVIEFHPGLTQTSVDDFSDRLRALNFKVTLTRTADVNQVMVYGVR
jgi:FkbM family methyltransferase